MFIKPRPEIERLDHCPHGGLDLTELKAFGLNPDRVIDFSVSSNPYSCPPGVRKILSSVAIDRYPDSEAAEFKKAIAHHLDVETDNILAGSGAMEIIRLIALTYFGHGDTVVCFKPTFGEYEVACRISGADVIEKWAREEDRFSFNTVEMETSIRQYIPKGVFLCNPANPSGQYLKRWEVEQIIDATREGLVILDESYTAFTESRWSSSDLIARNNVVIVRSMTKDYALAGLRIGYALANREVIAYLKRSCPPWNVNTVAQQAGLVAIKESSYLRQCELKIRSAKKFLMAELDRLGFSVLPSSTNFFLVKVGDARSFRSSLLRYGIIVRDCTSFGLPQYIRIATLKMDQCRRLIAVIEELRATGRMLL